MGANVHGKLGDITFTQRLMSVTVVDLFASVPLPFEAIDAGGLHTSAVRKHIPRDVYEAAALDGAGAWRAFWAITLPLLRPVFLFVFVTHIIGSFQIFGQVFILTQGGPGDATRTVVQHLYETAFQNFFQFGSASAMAWVLFAVILVFSLLQFRLLRGHTQY